MSKQARFRRKAFTLIELLVVVAIIALLIAILLPALRQAKSQTREVVCRSNMKQLATAFLSYAAEFNAHLPGSTDDFIGNDAATAQRFCWLGTYRGGGGNDPSLVPAKGTVFPYAGQQTDVYKCPEDAIMATTERSDGDRVKPLYSYTAPSVLTGAPLELLKRTRWNPTPGNNFNWTENYRNGKTMGVSPPWMIIEEDEAYYLAYVTDSAWSNADMISNRHDGRGAVARIDGSVESTKFQRQPHFDSWKVYYELQDGRVVDAGPWGEDITFGFITRRPCRAEVPIQ